MSHSPEVVRVTGLDCTSRSRAVVRRDRIYPGRIYCEFPRYASLTPDEAVALANRFADVLGGEDE